MAASASIKVSTTSSRRKAAGGKRLQASQNIYLPVLLGILIVILWQSGILARLLNATDFVLPRPTKIASIYSDIRADVWANIRLTASVAVLGLIIGSLIGYGAAVLAAIFPNVGGGGLAVVGAFASIPIVALAPVLNNWTRSVSKDAEVRSFVSKTIVVILICAADMGLNAYRGLTELPPFAEDLMHTYAATRRTTFIKLRLPNSVPFVFTALKISVPACIMTAIVAEYFAEYVGGVGREIRENIVMAQYATAWVYIMVACAMGIVFYAVLMLIKSIAMRNYHLS